MSRILVNLIIILTIVNNAFSQKYEPINLGDKINSSQSEFAPFISADGKTLYFSSTNRVINIGGTKDYSDIYYSQIQPDGSFSEAVNIGKPINSAEYGEIIVSVTPDGNTILFSRKFAPNSLYISNKTINGWSEPRPIIIRDINIPEYILYNLGSDGRTLLIGFKGDDGEGEIDLWVSFLMSDSTFTKPKNLGKTINTPLIDYSPFLAPDMKTLYFSSNGHIGIGGRDIFKSERLDDTWTNWTEPSNLGSTINTELDEFYYCVSSIGDYAYIASSFNSLGVLDINKIPLPDIAKPRPVVLVSGKVINSKDNKFIEASITYENLSTGEKLGIAKSNPSDGKYLIVLPAGQSYAFRAESPGFYSISENIDLTKKNNNDKLEQNLYLKPIEIGSVIKLNNIFFDFNQFNLKEESFVELNRLVNLLLKNETMEIEVSGHTDNVGKPDYNLQLSKNRAIAVKEYLVNKGISDKRITAKGFGSAMPLSPNDTEEGKNQNRRVEFTILKY